MAVWKTRWVLTFWSLTALLVVGADAWLFVDLDKQFVTAGALGAAAA